VGPWTLEETISLGATTHVHRARNELTGQQGALKLFIDGTLGPQELQALSLAHPNLPVLLDSGETPEGQLYIVTEYIPGQTLEAVLATLGPLPPRDAVTITERLTSVLRLTHGSGLLHRDLKPSNVIIPDKRGLEGVILLDFSLAGQLETGTEQTATGGLFGTPNYWAPEQLTNAPHTRATDIWGLGVLLHEMLTGHTPFMRDDWRETLIAIQTGTLDLPESDPWDLNPILARCLAKDHHERFQDTGELLQALQGWLTQDAALNGARPPCPAPAPMAAPWPEALPESAPPPESSSPFDPALLDSLQPETRVKRGPRLVLIIAGLLGAVAVAALTATLLKAPRAPMAPPTMPTADDVSPDAPKAPETPVPALPRAPATAPGGASNKPASPPPPPAPGRDSPAPPSGLPLWAYLLPLLVAGTMWLLVRKLLGKARTDPEAPPLNTLRGDERRQALTHQMRSALDDMINRSRNDAPANFMAHSIALAMEDFGGPGQSENHATSLEQTIKLLELLDRRIPTTLVPWYERHNEQLALAVSLAGLLLTLLGMLSPFAQGR
jgi:serine/threonine-protein kinase